MYMYLKACRSLIQDHDRNFHYSVKDGSCCAESMDAVNVFVSQHARPLLSKNVNLVTLTLAVEF